MKLKRNFDIEINILKKHFSFIFFLHHFLCIQLSFLLFSETLLRIHCPPPSHFQLGAYSSPPPRRTLSFFRRTCRRSLSSHTLSLLQAITYLSLLLLFSFFPFLSQNQKQGFFPNLRRSRLFRSTSRFWVVRNRVVVVALSERVCDLTMQNLHNLIYRLSSTSLGKSTNTSRLLKQNVGCNLLVDSVSTLKHVQGAWLTTLREFSAKSGGFGGGDTKNEWDKSVSEPFPGPTSDDLGWDSVSSWSTGLTKEHFDGEAVGRKASGGGFSESPQSSIVSGLQEYEDTVRELEAENRKSKVYVEKWGERMREMSILLKQVKEPGARGSYLKDSEKAEMYRLHKENPEVYTIEKLAKDYRIMRQRVHAILWLKELEEEEEKKLGHPLDDSIELLLDDFPEFFKSHDREFHVASLPYKPDFKVMPEGWDGTTRDLDEVHYEISQKEDEMLYKEFVERLNFNKKKVAGEVFCHKYSRRRAADGWKFTVEKMGPRGKRGSGGGWKFVSLPDGSSRPLNEMEKMYVRRETPRHRRKILP